MPSYVLDPAVDLDLDTIAEFVGADNPSAAVRLLVEFQARFELIARNPGIGHYFAPHLDLPRLRVHVYGRYLIAYDPDSTPLRILAVFHGMRSPDTIQRLLRPRESDSD